LIDGAASGRIGPVYGHSTYDAVPPVAPRRFAMGLVSQTGLTFDLLRDAVEWFLEQSLSRFTDPYAEEQGPSTRVGDTLVLRLRRGSRVPDMTEPTPARAASGPTPLTPRRGLSARRALAELPHSMSGSGRGRPSSRWSGCLRTGRQPWWTWVREPGLSAASCFIGSLR